MRTRERTLADWSLATGLIRYNVGYIKRFYDPSHLLYFLPVFRQGDPGEGGYNSALTLTAEQGMLRSDLLPSGDPYIHTPPRLDMSTAIK